MHVNNKKCNKKMRGLSAISFQLKKTEGRSCGKLLKLKVDS